MTKRDDENESEAFAISQMTTDWLSRALSAAGVNDAQVLGFRTTPVGTGQAALCCRIELDGTARDANLPRSIIGKFPADDEASRASATQGGTYLREVEFYRVLQPLVSIRTPRCHLAEIRDRGPEFALLLEDLAPADQGDQIAGCDEPFAREALLQLIGLHAPTWRDSAILKLPWVNSYHPHRAKFMMQIYKHGLPAFLDRCAHGLTTEEIAFLQRLGQEEEYPCFAENRIFCVVHNDFRLDNFLYEEDRVADTLHVVDWQTYGSGNPMTDVAYFLGGCLLPEVRSAVETELVAEYHENLTASGVTGYTLGECWDDYRIGAFHGLMYAMAGMVHVTRSERGDEMFATMAQRHARQVLDLGADDVLT